jgi:hypothetical protein
MRGLKGCACLSRLSHPWSLCSRACGIALTQFAAEICDAMRQQSRAPCCARQHSRLLCKQLVLQSSRYMCAELACACLIGIDASKYTSTQWWSNIMDLTSALCCCVRGVSCKMPNVQRSLKTSYNHSTWSLQCSYTHLQNDHASANACTSCCETAGALTSRLKWSSHLLLFCGFTYDVIKRSKEVLRTATHLQPALLQCVAHRLALAQQQ